MNRIEKMEFHGLALQTPWGVARVARALLSGVDATASVDRMRCAEIRLEGVAADFSPAPAQKQPDAGAWRFEPAAGAEGRLRAYVTDAAWVIDADVTVPVERGRIDFNRATVEHIGPDSALSLGRAGLHVDAPGRRTPLFVWSADHVPGARYAQQASMLGPRGDRGALELRPFVEALLAGVALGAPAAGSRELLARTRLAGHLRLGDGVVGTDRHRVVLTGSDQGRNRVELSSMPSGQGFGVHVFELAASDLRAELPGRVATADTLGGTLALHVEDPAGKLSVAAKIAELTLRGVAVQPAA